MEPFIGQIILFAGNFAPRGWAFCDGQLLAISSNTALFSILGTTYGGDGRTTFGLPELRGRSPVHPGTGPGLAPIRLGQKGGTQTTTLGINNIPSHHHPAGSLAIGVATIGGGEDDPAGALLSPGPEVFSNGNQAAQMGNDSVVGNTANVGNGQAFNNYHPYLGVNYIIALVGLFPSRS